MKKTEDSRLKTTVIYFLTAFAALQFFLATGPYFGAIGFKDFYYASFEAFGSGGWHAYFHRTTNRSESFEISLRDSEDRIIKRYQVPAALLDSYDRYFQYTYYMRPERQNSLLKTTCAAFAKKLEARAGERVVIVEHRVTTRSFKDFYRYEPSQAETAEIELARC